MPRALPAPSPSRPLAMSASPVLPPSDPSVPDTAIATLGGTYAPSENEALAAIDAGGPSLCSGRLKLPHIHHSLVGPCTAGAPKQSSTSTLAACSLAVPLNNTRDLCGEGGHRGRNRGHKPAGRNALQHTPAPAGGHPAHTRACEGPAPSARKQVGPSRSLPRRAGAASPWVAPFQTERRGRRSHPPAASCPKHQRRPS
eukprot:scaffold1077_cov388-Prasinococcus_capsulatus_cf.AAC.4